MIKMYALEVYGVYRHFQQYFSYIVAVKMYENSRIFIMASLTNLSRQVNIDSNVGRTLSQSGNIVRYILLISRRCMVESNNSVSHGKVSDCIVY
jgi:hypothetical protein